MRQRLARRVEPDGLLEDLAGFGPASDEGQGPAELKVGLGSLWIQADSFLVARDGVVGLLLGDQRVAELLVSTRVIREQGQALAQVPFCCAVFPIADERCTEKATQTDVRRVLLERISTDLRRHLRLAGAQKGDGPVERTLAIGGFVDGHLSRKTCRVRGGASMGRATNLSLAVIDRMSIRNTLRGVAIFPVVVSPRSQAGRFDRVGIIQSTL